MILIIIIAFISLILLMILHELGHFLTAKKFGVKVEEFGIGYPPRLFGKKFGETIYSINLLPFGAFVKIMGETESVDDPRSFSKKPFWQKSLIILGGVISFWVVSAVLFSIVMAIGAPTQISDDETDNLINPKVQILGIAPSSPAESAGIKVGDQVLKVKSQLSGESAINKVADFQKFIDENKGKEIAITIKRGSDVFDVNLVPRFSPPSGEGALGVVLARTALVAYPWYLAPIEGIKATWNLTKLAVESWITALTKLVQKQPTGVQIVGPVGIFSLFVQTGEMGATYFIQLIAIVSIFLALFNILPIPATDGGKMLFLIIEKLRGRPINEKITQNIELAFFSLLIILMIFVTINDIQRIF